MNAYNKCHAKRRSIVVMVMIYQKDTRDEDHPRNAFARDMVQPSSIALKRRETALYPP